MKKLKQLGALFLALVLAVSCLTAVPALATENPTAQREVVYSENFEDGAGTFVTGKYARVRQCEDANGNHYIMVEVDPEKASSVATYKRSANSAGRWGTEFFAWPLEAKPVGFNMENGKNYQISFEGSYVKDGTFAKPEWGTQVLYATGTTIWSAANETLPRTAVNQIFTWAPSDEAVSSKDGWFYCKTPDNWLKNVGFGAEQSGDQTTGYTYTGDAPLSSYQVRSGLGPEIAKVLAENKFYCGKGTGLYDAAGNLKTGETFGTEYKFTLSREDFYGTEAIFSGLTTEEEKNAKMDSYIYEEDGKTVKTYSLAMDCSFLKCSERIAAFKEYLINHPIGYAMDNFTITAEAATSNNMVTVGEHGQVTVGGEIITAGESKTITVDRAAGITGKAIPDAGFKLSAITYGGNAVAFDDENNFKISGDKIEKDQILTVIFAAEVTSYSNTVTVGEHGKVTIGSETVAAGESQTITVGVKENITGKAIPDDNYEVEAVTYGGEAVAIDTENNFTVAAEKVGEGKSLAVTFRKIKDAPEATKRVVVYQEDFEEGTGTFTTDPEARVRQHEDANGNHYISVAVNPGKAKEIATYTRGQNAAGRWGTEFFAWPLQANPSNFVMQNGKNYQITYEGSLLKGTEFSVPDWGANVLYMNGNTIWTAANESQPRTAKNQLFVWEPTGDAVSGKDGWFYGSTPANWLKDAGFGVAQNGDRTTGYGYTGDATMKSYLVRTNLAPTLARVMAEKKFYCGGGTGLYDAAGNLKTGQTFGAEYKFTLSREDFYGTEAIFSGLTTEEEKNAKMDAYIYEEDGKTVKNYSLAMDCSFLYCKERVDAFTDYLNNNPVAYTMDNFTITAEVATYTNTVFVGENGQVDITLDQASGTSETIAAGESKTLTVDTQNGIAGAVKPDEGYQVASVKYGEDKIEVDSKNRFHVDGSKIDGGKTLTITFESEQEATEITKRVVVYKEDFEEGTGTFVTGSEVRVVQREEESGNHYIVVEVNPNKAKAIATYTRAQNAAGRWGTEFFSWPFEAHPVNFIMQNGKNYQFSFEGSFLNDTTFNKTDWGTNVLYTSGKSIWSSASPSVPRAATNQLFTWSPTGDAVSDKDGWFYCSTPDNWLKDVGFGLEQSGDPTSGYTYTGDVALGYFQVRTNLAVEIAKVLATNKFYCGGGSGLYDAAGNLKTGQTFGTEYKFTLTRDDFYGTEAIFEGLTTDEEKNAKMDEYIYEEDGKTPRTYTLAEDCSFLYCKERVREFTAYIKAHPVAYAMDNFMITAEISTYKNNVTVGEHGQVSIVTDPLSSNSETVLAGESKTISADTNNGIRGTATPETGYRLSAVTYDGEAIDFDSENNFQVTGEKIVSGKTLTISFEREKEAFRELYIARNGSDTEGDGTIDHPFATVERARDAIRSITVPEGGVTVYLREGTYPISSTIAFTSRDSGTKNAPITYRAYQNETVTFTGSEALDTSTIKKVTDEALLNRLSESYAKDHLYMLDLKAQGVTLPALTASGNTSGERIYMNGAALINARWPNDDKTGEQYFVRAQTGTLAEDQVGRYNGGNQPAVLAYTDDSNRSAKWQLKKDDAFLCGAIAYLWYPQCLRIDTIDVDNKQVVTTDKSYYGQATYTAKTERYLYFENLFEEIDQPGESYLDRETGILYFYPIGSVKNAKMDISRLNDSMVSVNGASYLNFEGINFVEGCRTALTINGNDITVRNTVIRGMGEDGVTAKGSRITVKNCDIYDYGRHGVDLRGGDRASLTSSENVITNNRIHGGYGLLSRGVYMDGVGHTVSHNDIYDFTQEAIRYTDLNNAVMEYNDIYDVQLINADGGAIYAGRNISDLGNMIRYNYFHDIGGYIGIHGQQSVFTDDGEVGPAIYGNILYHGGLPNFPLKTNGGQFHQIYQNIVIDNNLGIHMQNSGRGKTGVKNTMIPAKWWVYTQDIADVFGEANTNLFGNRKDLLFSDTWRDYYTKTEETKFWAPVFDYINPTLYGQAKEFYDSKDKSGFTAWMEKNIPEGNTNFIYDNVWIAVPRIMNGSGWAELSNNLTLSKEEGKGLFVDYGTDFTLTKDGLATIQKTIPGFEATDFSKIGVQEDVFSQAPVIAKAEIIGTPAVGKVLMANYDYSDKDGDDEAHSKIYWYRSDKENGEYIRITDGYGQYYTVKAEDENKYLRYEIKGRDITSAYGAAVVSENIHIDPNAAVVDKDALRALISKVSITLNEAVVGTEAGQYPAETKAALEAVLKDAQAVAENKDAYQYQVNSIVNKLQETYNLFLSSVVDPVAMLDVERISLSTLIADEKGWIAGEGDNLVFQNGSLIVGGGSNTLAEYTAKNYKNTQFNFTMKAEAIDPSLESVKEAWVGIYLRQNGNGWCWKESNRAAMLDLKQQLIQYQQYPVPTGWGTAIKGDMVLNNEKIELGKTYQVSVGIYDTKVDGQVYLELTMNGNKIYAQTIDGTGMYGLEGHFCISTGENSRLIVSPAKADMTELNAQTKAAMRLLEDAKAGDGYGEYPKAALDGVQKALDEAKIVADKKDALQYEVDQASLALRKAVITAKNQQNVSGSVKENGTITLNYAGQKAEINVKPDVTTVDIQVKKGVPMPETTVTGGGVSMNIPAGLTASDDYRLPLAGGVTGGQFKMGDVSKVYGAGAAPVSVNGLVRIVLIGEASKTVAYRNEQGGYTMVLKTITEDAASAAEAALKGTKNKAVRLNVGNDVVLYSYLISEYVTFTSKVAEPTIAPESPGSGSDNVIAPSVPSGGVGGNIGATHLKQFWDISGHWAEKEIQEMAQKGIVSGVTESTFEPDREITRAEFATLVVKTLNLKSEFLAEFTDVSEGAWYAPFVNAAANAGLISGYAGEFRPEDAITREEMAVVIVKVYQFRGGQLSSGKLNVFVDKDKISDWAVEYADQAVSTGFISGVTANTFGPKENATRAQVTAVLCRMLNR